MLEKCFAAFFTLAIMVTLAPRPVMAQSAAGGMPMRTPDGHPDVSGVFTFRTLTPLQRPAQFAGQETLTPEEAAAFEASERTRQNRDLFDPETGAPNAGYQSREDGGVLSYNEFWYERGIELTSDKRTSLIIDPPDGRYPPQTEAARMASRERSAYRREHMYDSYENRGMGDRCIMFSKSGPPIRSGAYNNNLMIFQTAEHVVILTEQARQARVIPLEDTAKPPFEQLAGVSRGHWEGEILVVETTQFRDWGNGRIGSDMQLVERLTRLDSDTIAYEYTVTDPSVYTAPYTVMMPFRRTDGPLFEYACHEGNIGLYGILAGARNLERLGRELRP
ncbi:MAG: hypothetical protein CL477_15965 [Acidobacteria bacterium]|jgi:hypothetical protein|nr:hypothetical protein [Acidobacteriota bacterium]HJN42846.1 hypothetical protein [Vicinamibacterales bacterium]